MKIPGCIDCDEKGEKCSSCDEDNNFVKNDDSGKCDCVKGFYLDDKKCK